MWHKEKITLLESDIKFIYELFYKLYIIAKNHAMIHYPIDREGQRPIAMSYIDCI